MKKCLAFILCAVLLLSFAAPKASAENIYPLNENGECAVNDVVFLNNYDTDSQARVFYEIFVGSFSDSDGDGIGDLRGIINRLDYLNDGNPESGLSLGVEGLWLTPVFVSPSYHKYDIADYYTVDSQFGTNDDLLELISLCHERGMLVILDLPINHTSKQHKWFQGFLNAHTLNNPYHRYYDYYSYIPVGSTVPAGHSYTKAQTAGIMYESNFSSDMPELNFDNEAVRQEVVKIGTYWLQKGVDGFRFDAAMYPYYGDHDKNVQFWNWYMDALRQVKPDLYTVAEVWSGDGIIDRYTECFNCFSFSYAQAEGLIASTAKAGDVNRFVRTTAQRLVQLTNANKSAMLIPFIANHDMDRAAGYMTVASGLAKIAANLYILSPGSPFIYYGEEIGLRGSRGGASTDANRRLAMLWGDGDTVQDPVGTTYDKKKQTPTTVQSLLGDSNGMYNYYKRLLMLRRANPEIANGTYIPLTLEGTKVGGFSAVWHSQTVTVLHNTTTHAQTIDLSQVDGAVFGFLAGVIGMEDASLNGTMLTIGSRTSVILRE